MLKITADFSIPELEKDLKDFIKDQENHMIDSLKKAGKQFVDRSRARTKAEGGFGNITWNLRSSIGYVLIKDYDVIDVYFPKIRAGSEGREIGIEYGHEIASYIQEEGQIALVCIAGMEYAVFVERVHGRDVISMQGLNFKREFDKILKQ